MTREQRFVVSLRNAFNVFRRLPLVRSTLIGAPPRACSVEDSTPMDVCMQWRRRNFKMDLPSDVNVLMKRGLLHITFCAHEGVRPHFIRRSKNRGMIWWHGRYTKRLTIGFAVAILAIEWCHTPNTEVLSQFMPRQ